MNFVRRRMGGISLINKELVAPGDLPKHLLISFAIGVLIYVKFTTENMDQYLESNSVKLMGGLKNALKRIKGNILDIMYESSFVLWKMLSDKDLVDKIVLSDERDAISENLREEPVHER